MRCGLPVCILDTLHIHKAAQGIGVSRDLVRFETIHF